MRIAIVGTGYVGLVSGVCFAQMGNEVICVDVDSDKITQLQNGEVTIYEPGLQEMLSDNIDNNRLRFTTDITEALCIAKLCFIAVGTPMGEDGSADLQFVLQVAKGIGEAMNHHLFVIDKSTVPVGTADKVKAVIQQALHKRESNLSFSMISNPEFLKEGAAVDDFMKPDRVVVGVEDDESLGMMQELYAPFMCNHDRLIVMDIKSAEMTKYAANAMLATKISFMSEMSQICERVGANLNDVRKGIGSDSRIGYNFIYPGCGYGGSCFPKDVQALIKTAQDNDYTPHMLQAVDEVNYRQKRFIVSKITKRFGDDLSGKTIAIWGLAFKPETDDMREATAIVIIKELIAKGAKINAYDPKAMDQAKGYYLKHISPITYADNKYEVLNDADALILVTEWKEFRSPNFNEIKQRLTNAIIFDGRNQYDAPRMAQYGFEYYPIGVSMKLHIRYLTMNPTIQQALKDHIATFERLDQLQQPIQQAGELIITALQQGNKIILCGNGGSAADAQHIAAELMGRYLIERRPLPALALTTDTSALSAIGNDYGYDEVFSRQFSGIAQQGDVLIGISTSGHSPNVIKALQQAMHLQCHTIGLIGKDGGGMKAYCHIPLIVPSAITPRIQEAHIFIGHTLCELVDEAITNGVLQ